MSTLSSSSTDAEVEAAYDDSASYLEDESTAKAMAHVTAGTILLRRLASEMRQGSTQLRYEPKLVQDSVALARAYAVASGATGSPRVVRVNFIPGRE